MKSYYSIVSIATKPQFDEKFGVGLICVSPNETFFHFSMEKFKIVSKLLSSEAKSLALSNLVSIAEGIKDSKETPDQLFKGGEKSSLVQETYIGYLNRYNNSLVQFSLPQTIDLNIDWDIYKKLFKKYIYTNEIFEIASQLSEPNKIDTFRTNFKYSVHKYVNTDYNVSNKIISDLIYPIKVDLFGKNDAFVTGQTIDFKKGKSALHNAINEYMYLALSTEMKDEKAKCFLLGEEPKKSMTHNHLIWDSVRKTKQVEFVPLKESGKVLEYLKEHNVEPVE